MKAKQIIKISLLAVGALVLIGIGTLAWTFTAGLREPVAVRMPDYWPTDGWLTSTPEEQGFASAKLAEGIQNIRGREIDIDSLLIIRNGYVVLDAHFYPYDGKFPHDLASVTKSVMTTLIGIAADQGKLDLDAPIVSFFPNRTIANLDERKSHLTVRHLASMANGMESGCLEGDAPTIDAMRANPDYVQAALDRPMVAEPGTEFCYDSPGMHLLSAVLQEATGMTALDFARQYLFEPLGIRDVIWEIDPQGYNRGWGDVHLLPEDAAKLGYLWLHRGQWEGKQIVSESWVLDSVKPHKLFVGDDIAYGNGWWISLGDYYASGRGGQKIHVISTRNTVVVTTGAGFEYDDINEWLMPLLLRANKPLPANPEGRTALAAALASVEQDATSQTAEYMPEAAAQISGKLYNCESSPAGIETVRMEFTDPKQATLFLKMDGTDMVLPIGLDGSFRISPEGAGFRGYWKDARTFQFDVFNIGVLTRQVLLDGDRLEFSLPEAGLTVPCQAQTQ
ncbi:MAG TPA: serine hydrolase [Anaerolineales bacterium]|nr:serine hydrolase [Anaerolineales bacterium]